MQEKKQYTAAFYTLGCRVNQYETRALEEKFIEKGFRIGSFDDVCDVYVINTCTVTAESDRKSRQLIRRARHRGGENAVVMAMGCMIQVDASDDFSAAGLDYAVGTRDKLSLADKALELLAGKYLSKTVNRADFSAVTEMDSMCITGSDNTRAFLKISDGCDNNCSYCIIPMARGGVFSKPMDAVCDEVTTLTAGGWREVVLTGIETAAYGRETRGSAEPYDLTDLIERVDALPCALMRIRLGSLEPTVIRENNIARLAACKKLMPHYHLSLQSGSDAVLAAMRRKYNTRMFEAVAARLRKYIPNVTLTTDIIVGFPGETEEMFDETCDFVRKCGFLYVHIFPYSDRAGTDASRMAGKLSAAEKKSRAARLKAVMLETRRTVLESNLGTRRTVLVEKVVRGVAYGYTENYIETRVNVKDVPGVTKNSLIPVRLDGIADDLSYVTATPETGEPIL